MTQVTTLSPVWPMLAPGDYVICGRRLGRTVNVDGKLVTRWDPRFAWVRRELARRLLPRTFSTTEVQR